MSRARRETEARSGPGSAVKIALAHSLSIGIFGNVQTGYLEAGVTGGQSDKVQAIKTRFDALDAQVIAIDAGLETLAGPRRDALAKKRETVAAVMKAFETRIVKNKEDERQTMLDDLGRAAPAIAKLEQDVADEVAFQDKQTKLVADLRTGVAPAGTYADPPGANAAERETAKTNRERITLALRRIDSAGRGAIDMFDPVAMQQVSRDAAAAAAGLEDIRAAIEDRENLGAALTADLLRYVPASPPAVATATAAENAALVRRRDPVQRDLAAAQTLEALNALRQAVIAVGDARRLTEEAVRKRAARKLVIATAADNVKDPPDAAPARLAAERGVITRALAKPLLDDAALLAADAGLVLLRDAQLRVAAETAKLRQLRDVGRSQLGDVVAGLPALDGLRQIRSAQGASQAIDGQIAICEAALASPLDATRLANLDGNIWLLRTQIANMVKGATSNPQIKPVLASYVAAEADKLAREARGMPGGGELTKLKADAENSARLVGGHLTDGSGASIGRATTELEKLAGFVATLRSTADDVQVKLTEIQAQLLSQIAVADPAGTTTIFAGLLAASRQAVRDCFAGTLDQAAVDRADGEVARFKALLVRASADVVATAQVGQARAALAGSFAGAKSGARAPVQGELQHLLDLAEARAALDGADRDMVGAAALYAQVRARVAEIGTEPPVAAGTFTGVNAGGLPVSTALIGKVSALAGATLLGSLDAAGKSALCDAVNTHEGEINDLLAGGLAGNQKIFAAIVTQCGGKGLVALATAFAGVDGAAGRASLLALVDNGGLSENPQALAAMLQHGVVAVPPVDPAVQRTQNATRIKGMVTAFDDPAGHAAMRGMLTDCALGTAPVAGVPAAIGSVFHDGCDGDATRLRAFADGFAGDDDEAVEDRANLANLINEGGVGDHPLVLGPLVKTCGIDALKGVGESFADAADAANLKALLDHGGMSGDVTQAGHQHEHPDTLAKMLHDGFDDDPDKLQQYTTAFQGHEQESKDMLDALNEWPHQDRARRQPGVAMKKLLGPGKFNGRVADLQIVFTTEVLKCTDATRRKQAVRFAPSFRETSAGDKSVPSRPPAGGQTKVTASVFKRHKPETYDHSKTNHVNTQFPPGTDVEALVAQTLAALPRAPAAGLDFDVTVGGFTVNIAFLTGTTVHHFCPLSQALPAPPHPHETPDFTSADIGCIIAAIKPSP